MAKKSKASKEATEREDEGGEESEEEEDEAPRKSKKNKKAAKAAKSESSNGNVVTLKQLASDADCTPQVARQKLRAAGIKREDGSRWQWDKGSKALAKAQAALE